jgi:hypothetical protein
MSILDDAIREHLELKRQHGADDAELERLEDEAFGPPARPEEALDPLAEAPTEFLVAPGEDALGEEPAGEAELGDEHTAGRRINVADLQEPPPPPEQLGSEPEPPAEEEHPAMEHEAIGGASAEDEAAPDTEERHAIAEQPTEMFDVEEHLDVSTEAESPSDDDLAAAELSEPRLAPVDPVEGIEASAAAEASPSDEEIEEHADEFDEFFSEQRLSDELNQALEAPAEDEPAFPGTEETEPPPPPPTEEATAIHPVHQEEEHRNFAEEDDEDEDDDLVEEDAGEPQAEDERPPAGHDAEHQDALEETPDFLADDPEDENLWFEQKPPKDIDFGD